MKIVGYVPDLMDRSKVSAAAPAATFVATPAALLDPALGGSALGDADVLVVDLARPGVVDVLSRLCAGPARVIAFGSHVDEDTLAAARAAGCTEVLPRSQFFRRLSELLAE